ncbi:MAG: hypothetical protein ABEL76_02590 [Bradymonadaceae bacterium]
MVVEAILTLLVIGLFVGFGIAMALWRYGLGSFFHYDQVEREDDSACLVCDSRARATPDSPCPECGFDPANPGDEEIRRALEQLDRLERISSQLENVFIDAYLVVGVENILARVHELREFDCIDADEVPDVAPGELVDLVEERRASAAAQDKIEGCFGVIGDAKVTLKKQIRQKYYSQVSSSGQVEW